MYAARKAGVVLGVGGSKENTLMLYDLFVECPVSEGGFSDFVVSQDCEVMPMARLAVRVKFWIGSIARNMNQSSLERLPMKGYSLPNLRPSEVQRATLHPQFPSRGGTARGKVCHALSPEGALSTHNSCFHFSS